MVQICHLCKKGEIVHDKRMSGLICTGCGECFELGAFTDEVQYREDERGRYMAVGTTYNVEKGFVNSKFSNHAQFMTSVDNARSILKRYCDKLYISESFAQISSGFYQQLLMKKFMNGRRLNVVLAACLYISVRSEGANVILLDISDVSEANVYDIGRYYFQIIRILHFNIQTVDPCEYTIRFVDMLNLGDRSLAQVKRTSVSIRDTANRLVQRMKRDWIHFGRRPSGVCAAAVLVSCRINNVRCTIKDIISIAKVCESTIRKRINEFIATPASKLTYKEFMSQDLDQEEDPPSYKIATFKDAVEENLEKVEKYQEIIEEHLNDSRQKLRGVYAKFLKEILITQNEAESEGKKIEITDDDNNIIQEAILDQNILAVNENIVSKLNKELKIGTDKNGNPSAEEIEYWSQFRPSAKSLGLLKREETNEIDCKAPYEDLLNEDLNDMDDDELNAYIISDEGEITQRHLEWNNLNSEYIKLMEEKEIKRSQNDDDSKSASSSKSNRKKRRKGNDDGVEASTTSEAVEAAFKAKNISLNGINLKELFNEDTSSSNVEKPKLPQNEVAPIIISNNEPISSENSKSSSDNPKDAQFVSIYHSYASKTTPDIEESSTQNTIIESTADDVPTAKLPPTEVESDESIPIADLTPPSSSNEEQNFTVPSTSKRKLDEEPEEELADEEDEDDYYDDEDDELSKIKQKYSMMGQNGEEEAYDDYEDIGF